MRHEGAHQSGRREIFAEIASLIRIASAAGPLRPAAEPVRHAVFVKNVGQPLQFAVAASRQKHLLAFGAQLLYFFNQCRHRAVETRRRPRKKRYVFAFRRPKPRVVRRRLRRGWQPVRAMPPGADTVLRPYQIAYAATLVRRRDALPPGILVALDQRGLVDQHAGGRQMFKDGLCRSRHRRVELPSGKYRDSGVLDRRVNRLLGPGDALSRQARVNRRQQLFRNRGLGQRQQHHFFDIAEER